MALLITGPPGVGKTTVIRVVMSGLAGARLGGFFTQEMRSRGVRSGFEVVTFDGRRAVLAHVDRRGDPRVGKYGVDAGVLETTARTSLSVSPGIDVYLVDEIGKMECLSWPPSASAAGASSPKSSAARTWRSGGSPATIATPSRPASLRGSGTMGESEGAVADDPGRIAGRVGGRAEVEQADTKIGAARPLDSATEGEDPTGVVVADGVGITRRDGSRRALVQSLRRRVGVVVAEVGADDEEGPGPQQRAQQVGDPLLLRDADRDRQDRNVAAERDLEEWQLNLESMLGRVRRIVHMRAQGAGVASEIAIDVDPTQGGEPAVGSGNRGAP